MMLIERESHLALLRKKFEEIAGGEGHSVFLFGESGIGKTSLVKEFTRQLRKNYKVYEGSCDAMFSPRPLAPLYDIAWQIKNDLIDNTADLHDRSALFSKFFQELKQRNEVSVIVFEDIHWADEATIDFIKFMARRIVQIPCLFILTYRDNEINADHPLINVFGQLPPDAFTKAELVPLSREAVVKMAEEKNYDGDKVYEVSGGNPYYVTEILSSYSEGVPANIRDAIISAYNRTGEKTRQVWDLLSVVPGRFETKYLQKFDPSYLDAIHNCMQLRILIQEDGQIYFKHELFRRAIEYSHSPLKRISLNKTILDLIIADFELNDEVERIVHYAKNANESDLVVRYAPLAAKHASCVGAHMEASKLYLTAIEYYKGDDEVLRISLYEKYAYESYLTHNIQQAIIYSGKELELLSRSGDIEKSADCMRFLSYLKWMDGDKNDSLKMAQRAVDALNNRPLSREKAMTFSNMSHLKMLSDDYDESLRWGQDAIMIAEQVNDVEALCHALNNVGTIRMNITESASDGNAQLRKSLCLALKHSFHEHAARAYTNLAGNEVKLKDYKNAAATLEEGIRYTEERELDFWKYTMHSINAKLKLETGKWKEAYVIADELLKYEYQLSFRIHAQLITCLINMRTNNLNVISSLIEAKNMAFAANQVQVMVPAIIALLEYEWLTSGTVVEDCDLQQVIIKAAKSVFQNEKCELAFWLKKVRGIELNCKVVHDAFRFDGTRVSSAYWQKTGNPYYRALFLFEGDDDDKKNAATTVQQLGADNVYDKMKQEMRSSGIKGIPRGLRKTTKLNPALLTGRDMDVLQLLRDGLQNKEIANKLFISAKTVDHHISSILFKLDVNSRVKAVNEAIKLDLIK